MARLVVMLIRFGMYNTNHLYRPGLPQSEEARYAVVEEVINDLELDVLAALELHAGTPQEGIDSSLRLAEATGLSCEIENSSESSPSYAVAKGNRSRLAASLLWRPDVVEPVPDSLQIVQPTKFWHSLGGVTLNFGGVQVGHDWYHGPPISWRTNLDDVLQERIAEAKLITEVMSRPEQNPLTIIAGDWNLLSADKLGDDYYDHLTLPPELDPALAELAQNRTAGAILRDGGLIDAAPALPGASLATRQLTTGHWPNKYGRRRIDLFRVLPRMLRAIRTYRVITSRAALRASDHLPVVIEYETDELRAA